jgi:hypothetical protein
VNLALAAVGLGLAVFSFVSKARNSVRSLSILIPSLVSCGANPPVLHLSLASPVAYFILMPHSCHLTPRMSPLQPLPLT